MKKKQTWLWVVLIFTTWACNPAKEMKTTGTIERLDPALDGIVSPDAKIEIIARDLIWSEGPLWIESEKMLLFSDVPQNVIYKWTESKGMEEYLRPSGNTGPDVGSAEPGSNGLLLDDKGNLVICQHGDRRLAMMTAPVSSPKSEFKSVADRYNGLRFHSPNDAVFRNSEYYFTDPAYGLPKQFEDSTKEMSYHGIYRVDAMGNVTLLSDHVSRPNGIAFSPDGKFLYVACSDPQKPVWYRFVVNETTEPDGQRTVNLSDVNIFYDATSNLAAKESGLPDGLKVDRNGIIYASGPGGVFIFDPNGKVLGRIRLPNAASNTALSPDEKTLFVTNDMYVLRIKMRD